MSIIGGIRSYYLHIEDSTYIILFPLNLVEYRMLFERVLGPCCIQIVFKFVYLLFNIFDKRRQKRLSWIIFVIEIDDCKNSKIGNN